MDKLHVGLGCRRVIAKKQAGTVSTFKEYTHPASLYYPAKCITGQYNEH